MIIAFEGADRLGKTTQAKLLAEKLNCKYIKFPNEELYSGKIIRRILNKELPFEPTSFQALQTLNKLESVNAIKKANKKDGNVVLDRYSLSCIVYGVADGLPEEWVLATNEYLIQPDLTFIMFGIPFETDNDIYGDKEHQEKIQELYSLYGNTVNGRVFGIKANGTIEDRHDLIFKTFLQRGIVFR